MNFSGCFPSAFPIPKGSVRHKQQSPPAPKMPRVPPEHGQPELPLPDKGMGVPWALLEFCWALQFFKPAVNNSAST